MAGLAVWNPCCQNVPDVCIVFISKFDIFRGNYPLYHIDRVIRETGKVVDNGFEEIYEAQAGATIATHCGKKTLGILYIAE